MANYRKLPLKHSCYSALSEAMSKFIEHLTLRRMDKLGNFLVFCTGESLHIFVCFAMHKASLEKVFALQGKNLLDKNQFSFTRVGPY